MTLAILLRRWRFSAASFIPLPNHNTRVQENKAEVLWFRLDRVYFSVPIESMQACFVCLSTCLTAWAFIEYVLNCTPLLTARERIDETRQNTIAEVKKNSCLFPSEKIHSRLVRVGIKADKGARTRANRIYTSSSRQVTAVRVTTVFSPFCVMLNAGS